MEDMAAIKKQVEAARATMCPCCFMPKMNCDCAYEGDKTEVYHGILGEGKLLNPGNQQNQQLGKQKAGRSNVKKL